MEHNKMNIAEEELLQLQWRRETVPRVFTIVSSKLSQRDLVSLLLVSPWLHRTLISYLPLWEVLSLFSLSSWWIVWMYFAVNWLFCDCTFPQVLDFHEMSNAGYRLLAALSLVSFSKAQFCTFRVRLLSNLMLCLLSFMISMQIQVILCVTLDMWCEFE